MLSIAVIGAGRIGRIHAANVAANSAARLAGVADVDTAAAEKLAHACGAGAVTLDAAFAADGRFFLGWEFDFATRNSGQQGIFGESNTSINWPLCGQLQPLCRQGCG